MSQDLFRFYLVDRVGYDPPPMFVNSLTLHRYFSGSHNYNYEIGCCSKTMFLESLGYFGEILIKLTPDFFCYTRNLIKTS